MATFRDLQIDWSMLCQECTDCWTPEDLQLAAELGKTLLERNKELETSLKQHQNVIEDQAQEIEYLTKQTVALREVNDSRLRIYEQLEVSIQDLERANHRLIVENTAERKHIKTLIVNVENLEQKCEDHQSTIDNLNLQIDTLKRKLSVYQEQQQQQRDNESVSSPTTQQRAPTNQEHASAKNEQQSTESDDSKPYRPDDAIQRMCSGSRSSPCQGTTDGKDCVDHSHDAGSVAEETGRTTATDVNDNSQQLAQVLGQLREVRAQNTRDQRRIQELEEQISLVLQQNQVLENQVIELHHSDEHMKSMHEEFTTLEEVKKGQMCSRCLRTVEPGDHIPDDDDSSILNEIMSASIQHHSSFNMEIQAATDSSPVTPKFDSAEASKKSQTTPSKYKYLVDEYEALLEEHRQNNRVLSTTTPYCSLQEELKNAGVVQPSPATTAVRPSRLHLGSTHDFSEAETSSSGFSDDTTGNKSTQTDRVTGTAALVRAIPDPDAGDYRYQISSPVDHHFRDRPEYQDLFREIFTVLKHAEDIRTTPPPASRPHLATTIPPPPPPVAPTAYESSPPDDEDTQSMLSSTMSELSQLEPTNIIETMIQSQNAPILEPPVPLKPILRPLVRQPLEYISMEARKRPGSTGSRRRRRSNKDATPPPSGADGSPRPQSPSSILIGSPKIQYVSGTNVRRRRSQTKQPSHCSPQQHLAAGTDDNNSSAAGYFWTRKLMNSPTPSQTKACFEFKPSPASHDLHKLKKLDLSYAEVLRSADSKKTASSQQQQNYRRKAHYH